MQRAFRKCSRLMMFTYLLVCAGKAFAGLSLESLISGYSDCRWVESGGVNTITFKVKFKDVWESDIPLDFNSRALFIYSFDKNGKINNKEVASGVWLGGVKGNGRRAENNFGYFKYYGHGIWREGAKFVAEFKIEILNKNLEWPGIQVYAGHVQKTVLNDLADARHEAIFIGPDSPVGECVKSTGMGKPPSPDISIKVNAPDWSLGELRTGENTKVFGNMADQLCFTYSASAVSGRSFVINAGNGNGTVNNRYRLTHTTDASQSVPYSLMLFSGISELTLPNAENKALPLNASGKTCFIPIFKTTVDKGVKRGSYSDILMFTVVTES